MTGPWLRPARHPCSYKSPAGVVCDRESVRLWWRRPDGSTMQTARLPRLPRGMTGYTRDDPAGAVEGRFRCDDHPLDKDPWPCLEAPRP